jgi:hypothetical protein
MQPETYVSAQNPESILVRHEPAINIITVAAQVTSVLRIDASLSSRRSIPARNATPG